MGGGEFPPAGGGEVPPPPPAEAGGGPELAPESKMDRDMNILLESDMYGNKFIDLGVAQQSLGKMGEELDKLLNS